MSLRWSRGALRHYDRRDPLRSDSVPASRYTLEVGGPTVRLQIDYLESARDLFDFSPVTATEARELLATVGVGERWRAGPLSARGMSGVYAQGYWIDDDPFGHEVTRSYGLRVDYSMSLALPITDDVAVDFVAGLALQAGVVDQHYWHEQHLDSGYALGWEADAGVRLRAGGAALVVGCSVEFDDYRAWRTGADLQPFATGFRGCYASFVLTF